MVYRLLQGTINLRRYHPMNRTLSPKTVGLGALTLAALLGILALVMSVGPFAAQASVAAQAQGVTNVISVSGIGTAYGTPDVAYIEVGADFTDENAANAFAQASETMTAVREALLALNIAETDLQTTSVGIYPMDSYGPMGEITGRTYRVNHILRVTVRDVSMVEAVINAAIGAGANNLYNLSFGIADTAALEQQARELAIADAQARAQQLADLLEVTVGAPVVISETFGGGGVQPYAYDMAAFGRGMGGGGGVAPIDTGQMTISVQVDVVFSIGQ
jgi:hypothetical protein